MTPKQWERLVDEMWEKHATGDKHGYKDLMRESGFKAACAELMVKGTEAFLKDSFFKAILK